MITHDNLDQLLDQLGFTKSGQKHSKTIVDATLTVDRKNGEISYPEAQGLKIHLRTTCNLAADENFVVLECVNRLLEKGYKPANIELEPQFKLGHGMSGGRADILVKDNASKPLLIIECKTAGSEFTRAWKKTLNDGDQLFSYAQQISETQFLCLYTSDLVDGALTYTSHIIAHRDNAKYLDDTGLKGFASATDVKERFAIWRDTYKLDHTTQGIFEPSIQTYQIGKDRYALDDLSTVSASDQQKQYHAFATILRQHNVSGREKAFDKLVNLLLCKLVDETLNPHDLKFYWKGVAYDSHFDLFDRLQQLYKDGMGKFLGEPITYIDRDAVRNAMRFIRQNPDATQKAVWHLFLQQKFYTNNDFSFIDVHNEKLFYQNAEVLLKVIQMWQDIKLTNEDGDSQFLGDLFEGFLDQGVKQSEGQYFTPLPICRFIMMSLPLHTLVAQHASPPKVIDYACGAGHFLTELARQLKPLVAQNQPHADIADYHKAIIGIEKEYRLSKVAKVAAFMHGQRDIAICYGDALVKTHSSHPQIADHSFDILVANPPYSVKGFLETLPETERAAYEITDTIDKLDTNNSIECFFIERAKQLLKTGGIAAIILPASILSNGNGTYIKTREILLQYFDIVAIAEFGSGTFGKTGTNTVTLFLRRKPTAPDTAEHYRERIGEWFAGDANQPVYQDEHLIDRYAAHIGVPAADYKTLLQGDAHGPWCQADYFDAYTAAFNDSTEIKNLYKQKKFNSLPKAEQDAEIDRRYLAFVHAIERDKLYYFVLASDQKCPVLIIKSPTDKSDLQRFVGYKWSDSKGDEGIKLFKDTQGRHVTVLYDETNRHTVGKLNRCIADSFEGRLTSIPATLSGFASIAQLVDMLDFSRVVFEKQIGLGLTLKGKPVQSKWPLQEVASLLCEINGPKPKVEESKIKVKGSIPVVTQSASSLIAGYVETSEFVTDLPLVVFGDHTCTFKYLEHPFVRGADGTQLLKCTNNLLPKYFYYALSQLKIHNAGKYERHFKYLKTEKIVVPPLGIQQQIITECEAVDNEVATAQISIAAARATIDRKIEQIRTTTARLSQIAVLNPSKTELRQISDDTSVSFVEMSSVSERGFIAQSVLKTLGTLRKGSYTYFAENDVLIAKITPCMENGKCALAVGLENGIGMGSSEFHVIRADPRRILPAFLFAFLNREAIRRSAAKVMTGSSGHRRVPESFYEALEIPLPALTEQRRIVAEVEAEQRAIATAEAVIAAAPARKQAILERYL